MIVRETVISQEVADQGAAVAAVKSVAEGMQNITQAAPEIMNKTTEYLTQPEVITKTITTPPSMWSNIALWFLVGALFALLVYLIISLIRKKP